MSSDPTSSEETERPTPHSILEAGGEAIGVLLAAIARSIEELLPGQVLEVVSSHSLAADAVQQWCHETEHELLHLLLDGEDGQFWIRKLEAAGAQELV